MTGNAIAYIPCAFCERKEMCSMCELTLRRNQIEWISVEERLPERSGKYLVATFDGRVGIGNLIDYYCDGDLSFDNYKVTHWMPLPEPPEGDEGK